MGVHGAGDIRADMASEEVPLPNHHLQSSPSAPGTPETIEGTLSSDDAFSDFALSLKQEINARIANPPTAIAEKGNSMHSGKLNCSHISQPSIWTLFVGHGCQDAKDSTSSGAFSLNAGQALNMYLILITAAWRSQHLTALLIAEHDCSEVIISCRPTAAA